MLLPSSLYLRRRKVTVAMPSSYSHKEQHRKKGDDNVQSFSSMVVLL
jgi:hypothetical protein